MRCEEVQEVLPAFVSDGDVSLAARRHISRCSECKQDLARYEALATGLGLLEGETLQPPAGLLYQLESIPARSHRVTSVRSHVARNRDLYLRGAAAAAVTAGAVGAVLWRKSRTRPVTA